MASIGNNLLPYEEEEEEYNIQDIVEIHYAWISHGESVTITNQKYSPPIPPEFKNKLYGYAPHDKVLYSGHQFIRTLFDQTHGVNIIYNNKGVKVGGPILRKEIDRKDYHQALQTADIKKQTQLRPLQFIAHHDNTGP